MGTKHRASKAAGLRPPVRTLNSNPALRIRAVSLYPILTPRVSGDSSQHVLIKLDAEDGITGVGEYADVNRPAADHA